MNPDAEMVMRCLAAEGQLQEALERIAELEREVDEQCRLNGKGSEREVALLGKVESLQRNLAAAREDALRYRWLRVAQLGMDVMFEAENEDGPTGVAYRLEGKQLDAAIDAAIDAARKEQP